MKICSNCKINKPVEDFQKRSSAKDGRTNLCKSCKREYDNNHYRNNPTRKEYIKSNRKKSFDESTRYILDYLNNHHCIDCGESDPVVLEFDHRDPSSKIGNIPELKRFSLKRVIEEIQKCDVRCANCHRRKTALQFGWTNKRNPSVQS
jgi:protein-arginine kinase activator protein McsA